MQQLVKRYPTLSYSRVQWLKVIISMHPFLLDVSLHVPHQPVCACWDPGGKPSGMRVYCPSLKFSQSTLDDSGRNRGGPSPMVQAACHQLAPTQGHQELSCTKCRICRVVATHSTLVSLLPRYTRAPTERHSSPVEVVLTGSGAALPGLIEIPKSLVGHGAID